MLWVLNGIHEGLIEPRAAVAAVIATIGYVNETRERRALEAAVAFVRNNILSDTWWFSEHPPTMRLLQDLGKHVGTSGYFQISEIRERWRKDKDMLPTPPEEGGRGK